MNTGASSYKNNSKSKARMNQLFFLFALASRLAAQPYFKEPAQFKLAGARHGPLAEYRAEYAALSRSRALRLKAGVPASALFGARSRSYFYSCLRPCLLG
jgi:hypothetical protein